MSKLTMWGIAWGATVITVFLIAGLIRAFNGTDRRKNE